MTSLRGRLRLWAAAWLVFQVASLSALVPRDCCPGHRRAPSAKQPSCHENTAATLCPLAAAGGAPCPMHRSGHADHDGPSSDKCSLRGTCDGPLAALSVLLTNQGVPTDSFVMALDLDESPVPAQGRGTLISRLASPDPPPPRA